MRNGTNGIYFPFCHFITSISQVSIHTIIQFDLDFQWDKYFLGCSQVKWKPPAPILEGQHLNYYNLLSERGHLRSQNC